MHWHALHEGLPETATYAFASRTDALNLLNRWLDLASLMELKAVDTTSQGGQPSFAVGPHDDSHTLVLALAACESLDCLVVGGEVDTLNIPGVGGVGVGIKSLRGM